MAKSTTTTPEAGEQAMRLNRYLARAGVASRRKSDDLIRGGTVSVNGQTVREPARNINPEKDRIECKSRAVSLPEICEYLLLHKPPSCLVTRSDERRRPTVYDLIEPMRAGTVSVGRLDMNTRGLLLFTDDGELAHRLMHPRYQVDKVYVACVSGRPTEEELDPLRTGMELEDGLTAPAAIRVLDYRHGMTQLELCIHEGRKRQVRRMLKAIGFPTIELIRTQLGGLGLGNLEERQWRRLDTGEINRLRLLVSLDNRHGRATKTDHHHRWARRRRQE